MEMVVENSWKVKRGNTQHLSTNGKSLDTTIAHVRPFANVDSSLIGSSFSI